MEKKTIVIETNKLIPYDLNNKIHPKEQIEAIKKSMDEVGYLNDIIVDENLVVLAGHGRLLAIQELGRERVDVQMVSGLTDEQKAKFRIYDNVIADQAEYNYDNIKIELSKLEDIEFTDLVVDILDIDIDGDADFKGQEPKSKEVNFSALDSGGGKKASCPNCGHEFIV